MKALFKKQITVAQAKETVERLKLMESWHWNQSADHRRRYERISKRRRNAESLLQEAEQAFIEASLEEEK